MPDSDPQPEHQCDHPRIPLRHARWLLWIIVWGTIIGQAAAVLLLLYGTAPLVANLYSRWVIGQPIPGGDAWVWPHVMPLSTMICYPAGFLIGMVTRVRPTASHPPDPVL